ncbi:MAG TPA: aldehyde dehydrogenase family protein [Chthonomonadaceae bacterium]|nr:aldehyde dehydrogenase family protein [Chthonomonadaceae bacterium]
MAEREASVERLWIGGQRVPASEGTSAPVYNPANGEILAEVAQAGLADVEAAVQSARCAFVGAWGAFGPGERAAALRRLAEVIRAHAEELAQLESRNVGKPISGARGEVGYSARVYEYYAGLIPIAGGQTVPLSARGTGLTFREPLGVCGLIVPWNFPLVILAWKLAPALAMGNTVVIKPAEWTPLTALRLGELALEAGIPAGVVNVIPGLGLVAGAALVRNPEVRKISFTGSTATGAQIMRMAADDIKRVSLELGGKSPSVVFADADLEKAAASVMSVYDNTGQDCCARSRYLVERSVYAEFVERFVENSRKVKIGDPQDEATEIGPLASLVQRERVEGYVRQGVAQGAKLCLGGKAPDGEAFARGCYYEPTVFADVTPGMTIAQKEIFGPVVSIMPFGTEEEAVHLANGTPYGLSGSLWTRDVARALRVVRRMEAGVISVNSSSSVHLEMPFGGFKQSGVGRELGPNALEHFSELKSVFIAAE